MLLLQFSLIIILTFVYGISFGIADIGDIYGEDCILIEPIYNHKFDFRPLKSDLGHALKNEKGDLFEFNVCGSLTKHCNNNPNAKACFTKGNKQFVLGTEHKLVYNNGKRYFYYSGGEQCSNGKNYSLTLNLLCDYTMDVQPFLIEPFADGECSFYVRWETEHACLPAPDNLKSNTCTVEDKENNHVFNLMPLSDSNQWVLDRNGSFFIINVCKPVLYGENAMCPAESGICFVNNNIGDIKQKFQNFGTAQPNPIIENGQLMMKFPSPVKCNTKENMTSVIYFNCDPEIKLGIPDFMGKKGCNYKFSWQTSLACNKVQPCVAYHPISGIPFDLNALANKQYSVKFNDKEYLFGICSSAGSPCLDNAGACETSNGQTTSLGTSTDHLNFNGTYAPYLLYQSGAVCQDKNQKWSTKIEFVCASKGMTAGPKIIENTNCQVVIHFVTELACQEQISCKVESYEEKLKIDLTPLISTSSNYIAEVSENLKLSNKTSYKFFLNVCRPLVPQYGLSCPAGSAACKTVMGTSTPEQEQSLGYADVSLTLIESSRAQLKYLRGSKCPADESTPMSSTIEFVCDIKSGKGNPILKSIIDKCHYQFYWSTSIMCSSHQCTFDANTCDIINEQINERFNIKSSKFAPDGKIVIKSNPNALAINICGSNRKAVMDYAQSTVKVFFDADGPCGIDGSISVEMRLVCSETEHRSSSSDAQSCSLVLTQETPEVCPLLGLSVPTTQPTSSTTERTDVTDNSKKETDYNKSKMVTTAVAIITVAMILAIGTSIVCRDPVKRNRITRLFRRKYPAVQYSRVNSTEEANLLLPQQGNLTDSDEELLI